MATTGSLRIDVIEAKLTRDTEFFSKMDPYTIISTRQQQFRTRTLNGAGKTPKWDQAFDIDVKYVGDDMTIKVMDEDVTASDLVSLTFYFLVNPCNNFLFLRRLVKLRSRSLPCALALALMSGSLLLTEASSLVRSISRAPGVLPPVLLLAELKQLPVLPSLSSLRDTEFQTK